MTPTRWQHFSHAADMGIRGIAPTCAGAFEQAAIALTAVITDPATVRPVDPVTIRCEAPDRELLLVDWLNALIYEMAVRHMLFSRFRVTLAENSLSATAWGEALSRKRHQPAVEIKGATYTELQVRQRHDGSWYAQCIVDV